MWAGEQPLALGQLRNLANAAWKSAFFMHFTSSFLTFLTAASASPLDGLYGLLVSWRIPLSLQYVLKASPQNYGPPVRADGLWETKVLEPLLDGPSGVEGGGGGQVVHVLVT